MKPFSDHFQWRFKPFWIDTDWKIFAFSTWDTEINASLGGERKINMDLFHAREFHSLCPLWEVNHCCYTSSFLSNQRERKKSPTHGLKRKISGGKLNIHQVIRWMMESPTQVHENFANSYQYANLCSSVLRLLLSFFISDKHKVCIKSSPFVPFIAVALLHAQTHTYSARFASSDGSDTLGKVKTLVIHVSFNRSALSKHKFCYIVR